MKADEEIAALRKALATYGVHKSTCLAHRTTGRFGSRSGMRWNKLHDDRTCTCGLSDLIRGGPKKEMLICQQCYRDYEEPAHASDYCCDACEEKHDRQLMGDPDVESGP